MSNNKQLSSLFIHVKEEEEESVMGGIGFRRWQDRNQNNSPNGVPGLPQDSFWSDLFAIPIMRYLLSWLNPGLLQPPTSSYGNAGGVGSGSLGLW